MREDVLIVLNEREPLKQQMAIALSDQLAARGLTHHRLKPSPKLAEIILERAPRILVSDFLLGDEGTAFDLLSRLRESDTKHRIECVLWTDERSVSVAVNAIKLGARDFIELGGTKDIEKLLRCLEEIASEKAEDETNRPSHRRTSFRLSEEPVAQAERSRACLLAAEMAVNRGTDVIVLNGPSGCGRTTLARHLHSLRKHAGAFAEIVLENWCGDAEEIFDGDRYGTAPLLSAGATVLIEHAEFDTDGELVEAFARRRKSETEHSETLLIIGTTSDETALAWSRLAGADVISMPSLSQCREDFVPLLQRFLLEAKHRSGQTRIELTPEFMELASQLEWPANVRELRACALDIFCSSPAMLREWVTSSKPASGRPPGDSAILSSALVKAKEQYEQAATVSSAVPPPLSARNALARCGGNYRVAAVHLGVGVPQLRSALRLAIDSAAVPHE